ncbi:MAG: chemotaxis protein CheW, partial [Planctomycetota bacterium]
VELDKTVLELLADPLTHLVRNSCDHGIEPPDERLRAGKAAAGRIQLAARQERGQILVEIRDDGRGLNRAAIARKALQQGMKRPAELERLSERQLYELILLPGFSTAEHVTDLSGRGVGMDVVRSNLEQLGGGIEIGSTAGQGTVFTLRLPLTLAIMPCLVLRSGAQRFVLPQRETEEIVRLSEGPGHSIERSHDEELLRLRGWLLPVLRLRNVLQSAAAVEAGPVGGACAPDGPGAGYVVVLRVGSQRFGLVVDEVLGGGDIVVKSLHPLLRSLGIYSGATILGDGTVALILSGEGLARLGGISARAAVESAEPAGDARLQHTLLLFRCGEAELLAAPLSAVRRVVRIASERIERVGARELVNVDGAAINVLRLDQFLDVSPCPARPWLYLVLPRNSAAPVGLLASEIVDTPTVAVDFDEQAYRADGVLGTAMLRGQIALFVDLDRICALWQTGRDPAPALPDPVRRKILVVEDTQFFRRLIASCLESAGYEVVTARDGHEAVAQLADGAFDLVVSDIEMPVMDGLALARHVRQVARTALPLLALTSLAGEADRNRLLAAGFDAHEVKFDRERFLRAVEELLARGGPAAAGPEGAPHA